MKLQAPIISLLKARNLKRVALVALGSAIGVGSTVVFQELQQVKQTPINPSQPSNPKRLTFDLLLEGEPVLGESSAPLTIVEFSDYQCPYCRQFQKNVFPGLKEDFIDQGLVRFIHKDLPLPFHQQAEASAAVARCAHRQNAFWLTHQALYDQQNCLGCLGPRAIAMEAGLREQELDQCLKDPAILIGIRSNQSEAGLHNITATPTFVIGPTIAATRHRGFIVEGALPWPQLRRIIEDELRSIKANKRP